MLISAGGTGGGVYPALAVAAALDKRTEVTWVGAQGAIESRLVPAAGIPFRAIPAAGVHGVGLRQLPGNALRLVQGGLAARALLRRIEPDVLFFTGGYVGVPMWLAGMRRPRVTLVPDVEPALAQRLISRGADRICVSTSDSLEHYPKAAPVVVTGYPTRFKPETIDRAAARNHFGLSPDRPILLVVGGSLGARSINRALWAALPELLQVADVLHVVGERDWFETPAPPVDVPGVYAPREYLHDDMGRALAAADLVLSRAGASALGDYPAFRLPSALVPYPHAWRYQSVNAMYLQSRRAARVVEDKALPDQLAQVVLDLLGDAQQLASMADAAGELARPEAARRIAELIELVGSGEAAA